MVITSLDVNGAAERMYPIEAGDDEMRTMLKMLARECFVNGVQWALESSSSLADGQVVYDYTTANGEDCGYIKTAMIDLSSSGLRDNERVKIAYMLSGGDAEEMD